MPHRIRIPPGLKSAEAERGLVDPVGVEVTGSHELLLIQILVRQFVNIIIVGFKWLAV